MEEIISYIMETPENVNGNILREKLKDFQKSGGDDSVLVSLIDRSITEIRNDNVTSIGNSVFLGCSALATVDLPNATSIGKGAFAGISSNAVINLGAAEGEIEGAPWGAPEGVTINYNVRPTSE